MIADGMARGKGREENAVEIVVYHFGHHLAIASLEVGENGIGDIGKVDHG